ncbi:MAG: O-antigen ligase family protein [Candidatus Magasanikbacteria bacterium]|nr:O-antigen ligase family protein [Candidatus Magasanikbacteria bacterium]
MEVFFFILGILLLLALCWRFNLASFYLLIFLAPFLGLVVDFSQYTFAQKIPGLADIQAPVADILAIIIFLSLILKTWVKSQRPNLFLPWINTFKETGLEFFLPFLVIGIVSLFNLEKEQLGGSFKYFLRPIVFFYLMWIVLPHFIITTKAILQKTIITLFSAGLIAASWGWLSTILKSGGDLWKRITPGSLGGLAPLTFNHNILAEVLVMAIPLAFYLFIRSQQNTNKTKEKLLFLSFIFLTLTTLLTFSRAAWLALLFELIIYLFIQNKKASAGATETRQQFWWKKMGVLFILLLPVIIYMAAFSFSSIVKSSTTTRLDMTGIAWTYFSAHPLIGNGVGTFTQLVGDTRLFTVEYGDPLDSHGVIQKLIAETGLLGLITFFIFVGWVTTQLYTSAKNSTEGKTLTTLILVSFLGCLVFQLFNTSYYNQHLWLIVGIGLAAKKVLPSNYL